MMWSMPTTRSIATAAAVCYGVFAAWVLGGSAGPQTARTVDDIALVAVSVLALVFAVAAARSTTGRLQSGWTVFSLALFAWTVGEVLWTIDELVLHKSAFPAPADVFFLTFPVGAAIAVLLFWTRRSNWSRGRVILDGVIVSGSLLVVSWLLVMRPLYETGTSSTLEFAVLVAYPCLDVITLTVAASALVSATAAQRRPLTLLTLGMTLMWVADNGYAFLQVQQEYYSGHVIDLAWIAAMLLFTVAAATGGELPDAEAAPEVPGWASVWLPYLPLMGAAVVLVASPVIATSSPLAMVVGPVIFGAVLMRQYVVVDHNRRLLATLRNQALRDPLTGLANRALFADRLDRALRSRPADGVPVGVMVIDLDDFKRINDTLGHQAGDEILKETGERLRRVFRPEDTVARLGGDEFAVLVEAPAALMEPLAARAVEAFERPLEVGHHELVMRPSIGLAVAGSDVILTGTELLNRADVAMYAAKRTSDPSLKTYTEDLSVGGGDGGFPPVPGEPAPARGIEAIHRLGQLRSALEHAELTLVYQPKVDLFSGAVVGFEALLRWPHPDRGLLGPNEFMPLVRRYELFDQVTEFLLNHALDDLREWRAAGIDLPVAINLSPPSLAMLELPQRVDAALASRGLTSRALSVEITEDLVLADIDRARQVLAELRGRGISVAIDDFGSGYSALRYLRDLRVEAIKFDRNFVAPIVEDPRGAALVRVVIDLARVLGIATVAEGVEDAQTADLLRRYGCDMAQGFYFSPPLAAAEVLRRFGTRKPADETAAVDQSAAEGVSRSDIELMQ